VASGTLRPIVGALKVFYSVTCPRDWKSIHSVRVPKTETLPIILARKQIRRLIDSTCLLHYRAFFQLCYSCGLRLGEAKNLQPGDIDSDRGQIIVRQGKGRKDRVVPIPSVTIELLRTLWMTHRNPHLLFPSRANKRRMASTTQPISNRSIQRAFHVIVQDLNLPKSGIRLHTLRHSYATHLLDDGVNLKVLQEYLGHASLQTTAIYLHLTRQGDEQARAIVERLLDERPSNEDGIDDRPDADGRRTSR